MEEEFKPAFKEIVLAHGVALALLWLMIAATVSLLPVPSFIVSPVDELAGIFAAALFVHRASSALRLHWEELYYVGEGVLRIRRSLASTTAVTVLLQNVTSVRVETPFFMRPFHVGTIWVYTCDCRARPLYNLKDAGKVARKIWLPPAIEPVFRPSVG